MVLPSQWKINFSLEWWMEIIQPLCGIPQSLWQQLCLVCCVPVYGCFVHRSPTVYLYYHLLAFSGVCSYHLVLVENPYFCTSPNEQVHPLYHIAIAGTAFG